MEQRLTAYAAAGFRNVEFPLKQVFDYLDDGHALRDVEKLLDAWKMQCVGGFEAPAACFAAGDVKKQCNDRIVANARLLAELGGTVLVVGTDGPAESMAADKVIGRIATTFAAIGRRIRRTGVQLAIEFNWSPVVKSLRTAAEIARRSGAENVGVLFDTAHYHCTPTKFDQLSPENVALIKHVHVNDMADKPGELSNCNADRVLPGEGCLDLKALLGQIEKHGYKGCFAIELFNEKLWAMPPRRAAKLMYESMRRLCRR